MKADDVRACLFLSSWRRERFRSVATLADDAMPSKELLMGCDLWLQWIRCRKVLSRRHVHVNSLLLVFRVCFAGKITIIFCDTIASRLDSLRIHHKMILMD